MIIRISGIREAIKDLDMTDDAIRRGVRRGLTRASVYLRDKIRDKFGKYQSTGGTGGGPWRRLQYKTIVRKRKKGFGASANSPLVKTGKMRDSIKSLINRDGTEAVISSDDPKLVYHIYGAPKRNVPRRDPVLVITKEEEDNIVRILEEEIYDEIFKNL